MNFKDFIMAHIEMDSPFGDLAKDIERSGDIPSNALDYGSIRKYLVSKRACKECLNALDRIHRKYLCQLTRSAV